MTKKKSLLLVVTILTLALILAIGATLAYLTDQRTATNILRIGSDASGKNSINIALREPSFIAQIDTERAKYPAADQDTKGGKYTDDGTNTTSAELNNIVPGKKIQKDPTVTNNGGNAAYIRFKLVLQDDQSGTLVDLTAAQKAVLFKATSAGGLGLQINPNYELNTTDGYYYLTNSTGKNVELASNATSALFVAAGDKTTMEVPAAWDYADIAAFAKVLNFQIVAEAVQADSFGVSNIPWMDADGTTPLTTTTAP